MARRTLIDFFDDLALLDGEFLVYDDGYRTWSLTYAQTAAAARGFAGRLREAGIGKGHAVAIWSENRPEWIVVLWGCLLEGVDSRPHRLPCVGGLPRPSGGDRQRARDPRRRGRRYRRAERSDVPDLVAVRTPIASSADRMSTGG